MYNGDFNDGFWDEYQWEAHLNEIEKKSAQLRRFISPDSQGNQPRWITLLRENKDELDAVDAFIEEELQIDEAYFPDDEDEAIDDDWDEEFDDDPFFDELEEEDDLFLDFNDDEDLDDGEEWKELSEDYAMSDYGSIEMLTIYNDARELAAVILQWAEGTKPKFFTSEYNEFVGNVLKIGAKIAGGYSFGFDPDFLGGNIAYTKKALYCANDALTILQRDLKGASCITVSQYRYFHERLFDLRNNTGIYIQELRERFNKGFE